MKFSAAEPVYSAKAVRAIAWQTCRRELNTAVSGFLKASHCVFSHCARMLLSDTAPFLSSGHSEAVSWLWMEGCRGRTVEWGRMRWTHLTRANRGAIKESAQPERQGLTFTEVDVYCSGCCTCQQGIEGFFVMWSKLEKSKMLKYQSKTWTNPDTIQCYICKSNLKYFLRYACIFQSWSYQSKL